MNGIMVRALVFLTLNYQELYYVYIHSTAFFFG